MPDVITPFSVAPGADPLSTEWGHPSSKALSSSLKRRPIALHGPPLSAFPKFFVWESLAIVGFFYHLFFRLNFYFVQFLHQRLLYSLAPNENMKNPFSSLSESFDVFQTFQLRGSQEEEQTRECDPYMICHLRHYFVRKVSSSKSGRVEREDKTGQDSCFPKKEEREGVRDEVTLPLQGAPTLRSAPFPKIPLQEC